MSAQRKWVQRPIQEIFRLMPKNGKITDCSDRETPNWATVPSG